jgi:hypothetical protein
VDQVGIEPQSTLLALWDRCSTLATGKNSLFWGYVVPAFFVNRDLILLTP